MQWLDVVWQLMRQFPNAFEFTEKLLVFLADALFSCQFGTFLGNSESERSDQGLNIRARTESVWTCVLANTDRFRNQSYLAAAVPLWPCTSVKKLALWERYFCRWDPEMHPVGGEPWTDTWACAGFESDAAVVTGHLSQRLIPLTTRAADSAATPPAPPSAHEEEHAEPMK